MSPVQSPEEVLMSHFIQATLGIFSFSYHQRILVFLCIGNLEKEPGGRAFLPKREMSMTANFSRKWEMSLQTLIRGVLASILAILSVVSNRSLQRKLRRKESKHKIDLNLELLKRTSFKTVIFTIFGSPKSEHFFYVL